MMKIEYRVVWCREGCRPKRKVFSTLRAVHHLLTLLGPEPWTAYTDKDPDELACCQGTTYDQCNCGGLTVREQSNQTRKDMPAFEYVRLETRAVTSWQPSDECAELLGVIQPAKVTA